MSGMSGALMNQSVGEKSHQLGEALPHSWELRENSPPVFLMTHATMPCTPETLS